MNTLPGLGGSVPRSKEDPARARRAEEYLGRLHHLELEIDGDAGRRYRERQEASENDAKAALRDHLITSFDFGSLWGQGPEFILQFTTVVTVIFAVVALGILQQMGTEQAGTILPAIAGYVLGHALARVARSGNSPLGGHRNSRLQEALPLD